MNNWKVINQVRPKMAFTSKSNEDVEEEWSTEMLNAALVQVDSLFKSPLLEFMPENSVQTSHFQSFYLATKLEQIIDVMWKHLERYTRLRAQFKKKLHTMVLAHTSSPRVVMDSVLKNPEETRTHLEKVKMYSRRKLVLALSKMLPLPSDVLINIIDKFVEIQDEEGPNDEDLWKIGDIEESKEVDESEINLKEHYVFMSGIYGTIRAEFSRILEKDLSILKILEVFYKGSNDDVMFV